jgi:DNA repair protein RecN (Recombination protein N)
MLSELRIQNLLLISSAHIEFVSGLNAFTGETGAGKSLLVDALGFLLGARGDASMVRPGAEQAEVSARFFISDESLVESLSHDLGVVFDDAGENPAELVLNRTIPRSGRARAHANGRPIAIPALRELGERLLDIHGQHENQSLLRPATRLEILDRYATALSERAAVRRAWSEAMEAARSLTELRRAARDRQGREDTMRFQLKELEEARLDDVDPGRLEDEVRLLKGAERIGAAATAARAALDGDDGESAATLIARALKNFSSIPDAGSEATNLVARMESILAEAREAARDADHLAEKARSDPQRLSDLEEARNRLRALERKHGRDLNGLRDLRLKLRTELSDLQEIDARTEEREAALASALQALRSAATKLSRKREAAARKLEKAVNIELASLGLKDAKLQISLTPHSGDPASADLSEEIDSADDEARRLLPARIRSTGAESVDILFSANPDLPRKPLKECASGGEISRVMLALKGVLARAGGADRLPVVVFDEVDSGVGGRLGAVLGKKLAELSRVRQVLCVTHQPQIAVYAQRQLKVEKLREDGATVIKVEAVEGDKRVDELALMLRGGSASAHTRAEALAMLKEARAAL